jgi:hypothetical protein
LDEFLGDDTDSSTALRIDHLRGSAELKVGRNLLHYSVVTR